VPDLAKGRSRTGPRPSPVAPRHLILALALGALSGVALFAAHPPLGVAPAAYLVAPLLVAAWRVLGAGDARVVDAPVAPAGATAGVALVAGLIGYGGMISWLIAPAGVVGYGLLVLVQAGWIAVWAIVVRPFVAWRAFPLIAASAWVGMDTLRGEFPLSGFRWGALADSQVDGAWLLPLARVLGASGVTFFVVLLGIALMDALLGMWRGDREHPPQAPIVQAVGAALVATLITVGPPPTEGTLDVLAVQGNDIEHWVAQVDNPPLAITSNLHRLTLEAVARGGAPDLVVWPESAIDRDPARPAWTVLGELADDAAAAAGTLVAGVSLDGPDDPARERIVGAWLLGPEGHTSPEDLYVKRRPVPFGEYVPGRALLSWIPALDQVPRDAVAGAGAQAFEVAPGVWAAVAICFETLFSDLVRTNVRAGDVDASIVLAITNDAAFQRSAEPDQHLAQSRMRAVETGRWVVHAALSGSSAFVDPEGRLHDATDLFTQAVIRRDVPLAVGPTPYLRIGDVTGLAGAMVMVLLLGHRLLASIAARRRGGPLGAR
jgi:apolipoprotein N-acyltransferase